MRKAAGDSARAAPSRVSIAHASASKLEQLADDVLCLGAGLVGVIDDYRALFHVEFGAGIDVKRIVKIRMIRRENQGAVSGGPRHQLDRRTVIDPQA